jgi:hypothetical protein
MSSHHDPTEFIDGDFEAHMSPHAAALAVPGPGPGPLHRAPSREEVDTKVVETQQRLAELRRAQEQLERERATLEETRRRQAEFQTGRQETLQNLTRGLGLLEEAEFSARRDAEQMGKTLAEFREALSKIQAIHEETWTKDNFGVELTRALTAVENGRMEWNSARLKFPILSGKAPEASAAESSETAPAPQSLFTVHTFGELCRFGFAFTWPVAVTLAMGLGTIIFLLLRR